MFNSIEIDNINRDWNQIFNFKKGRKRKASKDERKRII